MASQTFTALQVEHLLAQQKLTFDEKGLKTLLLDKGYLLQRSVLGGRVIGGGVALQVQEYIYHHYLSGEQKQAIYSSGYEIGSPLPVPDTSENAYHNYLAQTYGGIDVADLLKQIKKNITELTGVPFKVFLQKDRNLALKVMTLFYRICRIYRPQLFRLLKEESTDKANFEFRSAFPLQHGQSEKNSAVLAEILSHLTFSMPKLYTDQAWRILSDLALTGEAMAVYVKSEIEGEQFQPGCYSRHNISAALEECLKKPTVEHVTDPDRLDFLLYASLALREYSERKKSNHLVMQAVYKYPLQLRTLCCAKLPSFSDKDVITFLTGKEVTRIKPSLEKQAGFVELIVRQYTRDITEPLPLINKQIIKALILHDEKLGIHISSAITGVGNVQTSVTSILKDAERYTRRDPEGNYPDMRCYPEALLLYWDMRYHMAVRALMSKQVESGIQNMLAIAEWELQVDTSLIEYVQFSDIKTFQTLPRMAEKFMYQLGYQPGKVVNFTLD